MKTQEKHKGFAIASLVLSILSLLLILLPYIGIIFSILAVVFGSGHRDNGVATAGKVIGIISIVLNSLMLFLVIIGLLFLAAV